MFLLIDKPKDITSHDVINRLRRIAGIKKIGHAGTLDPNATGLLIVGIGRESTKKLGSLSKDTTKTYEAEIILGEERDTDDVEGEVRIMNNELGFTVDKPDKKQIIEVLNSFEGRQEQVPPAFSAIKISGKKAYDLARKGKEVSLESRQITVFESKLINYKYPILTAVFTVSSGTYIRALARDIGRELGTGAYLNNLRRTKISHYSVNDAVGLTELDSDNWKTYTITI